MVCSARDHGVTFHLQTAVLNHYTYNKEQRRIIRWQHHTYVRGTLDTGGTVAEELIFTPLPESAGRLWTAFRVTVTLRVCTKRNV